MRGNRYCLAGLGVTSALFPKHIAVLGMLQLALGDPMAALFGHATRSVGWSRMRSGKGFFGALGCAVVLTVVRACGASSSCKGRVSFVSGYDRMGMRSQATTP